ncbi:MAG: hypothetical protein ABW046_15795 [Actinoplanes sp.]
MGLISLGAALAYAGLAFIVVGIVVMTVQIRRGETGFRQMRGESAETRRAVRRAILDGGTDDPEIDRLARRAFRGMSTERWAQYLFRTLLALSVLLLVIGPHTATRIALQLAHILLWTGAIVLNRVNRRRLDNYRGLRPRQTADDAAG